MSRQRDEKRAALQRALRDAEKALNAYRGEARQDALVDVVTWAGRVVQRVWQKRLGSA